MLVTGTLWSHEWMQVLLIRTQLAFLILVLPMTKAVKELVLFGSPSTCLRRFLEPLPQSLHVVITQVVTSAEGTVLRHLVVLMHDPVETQEAFGCLSHAYISVETLRLRDYRLPFFQLTNCSQ